MPLKHEDGPSSFETAHEFALRSRQRALAGEDGSRRWYPSNFSCLGHDRERRPAAGLTLRPGTMVLASVRLKRI